MKDWISFYTTFKGRATRYDFNVRYLLVMLLVSMAAFVLDWIQQGEAIFTANAKPFFSNLVTFLFIFPTLAVTCRRLHDLGYSGWWQSPVYLLPLIVVVAAVFVFGVSVLVNPLLAGPMILIGAAAIITFYLVFYTALSCMRGTKGDNKYGSDPLIEENKNV